MKAVEIQAGGRPIRPHRLQASTSRPPLLDPGQQQPARRTPPGSPGRVSLVPLRDLLTVGPGQVVGNLLVFAALVSVPRILALAAGCSVLVEIAQYVLRLDRVSSVDDVLLNTAGAGPAALASRPWWRATAGA